MDTNEKFSIGSQAYDAPRAKSVKIEQQSAILTDSTFTGKTANESFSVTDVNW